MIRTERLVLRLLAGLGFFEPGRAARTMQRGDSVSLALPRAENLSAKP